MKTKSIPTLYIMVGVPGSGKSTWAKNNLIGIKYVSRDRVRFSLLSDTDEYFSKEKLVFQKFVDEISSNITNGYSVVADATNLNRQSRFKLVSAINTKQKYNIVFVYMNTSLETCLARNSTREGREKVPNLSIHSMYSA